MIHRISSSDRRFKNLDLGPGLNIIVADKTATSTSRNTRNGAGKTSLIEVINFVLGSSPEPEHFLRSKELRDHFFNVTVDIGSAKVVASRSGANPGRIYLEGDYELLGHPVELDEESNRHFLPNAKWREVLGDRFFNLKAQCAGSPTKNRPTFRSLISYFVRRQSDGAFAEAEKHYKNQATWDYQVNLSFLLNLDWLIPQEWQQVRDQEKSINALRSALKQGALGGEIIENAGKLRTQLAIAEKERDDMRARLEQFHVVDDYQRLEDEASGLTREINRLSDDNAVDSLLIRDLRQSLESEKPPPHVELRKVYDQVGIELPGVAIERFEAVANFHESVIQNRRSFLSSEIDSADQRVNQRRQEQKRLDDRRSQIMNTLQSSGALQHFAALQGELSRAETSVATIANKYEMARQLESKKAELDVKRGKLSTKLQQDIDAREEIVSHAILTFEEISKELYKEHGSLTIEATEDGPEFDTVIHAKRSMGKNHMQIFCFDMTLAVLNVERATPGFLIHDSHLFDGADERQIARALAIGARLAAEHGFQYLVTLNTDDLPKSEELPEGFDLQSFINPVRLTDEGDDGGLFGFRFS